MKRVSVTSFDVAREAGVSRTTVSLVLNNPQHESIRAETRQRVLDAAAALGYTPNSAARMLAYGSSATVGLVVSDARLLTDDGFVPRLLCGLNLALASSGYRILVEVVDDAASPTAYLDLVQGKRIDGLVVLSPRLQDQALWRLIKSGFPVVLVGSSSCPGEYTVQSHTGAGIRAVVRHLADLGHRRIGHIGYASPEVSGARIRRDKYRQALRLAGFEPEERLEAYGSWSVESGYRAMRDLLKRKTGLTAVFAGNDTLAMGAMAALREQGLAVPAAVSVIGFDDLPFAAFTAPPLTTVANPAIAQGQAAAGLLIDLMREEPVAERRITMPVRLVLRESTGPAAKNGKKDAANNGGHCAAF